MESYELENAKRQWAKLKGKPLSEKIRYILTYYKLFVGLGVLLLVAIAAGIIAVLNPQPKPVLSGILFNTFYEKSDENAFSDALCEKLERDPARYYIELTSVVIDPDQIEEVVEKVEGIYARIAAGDLDFIAGKTADIRHYANAEELDASEFLMLSEVLPEDLIQKLDEAGRIVRVETAYAGEVPFLVRLSGSAFMTELGFDTEDYVFGICCNLQRKEEIIAFCELLMEE